MARVHLPPDFREFLRLLNANRVEYLLIGGYAVAYHGYPRSTADMEIWIAARPDNAAKVVAAYRAYGIEDPAISTELFLKEDQIIRMGIPPMRLEVITGISGVRFDACFAAGVSDEWDGVPVRIIALEHLKINKKATGRHKDLDDLENLP